MLELLLSVDADPAGAVPGAPAPSAEDSEGTEGAADGVAGGDAGPPQATTAAVAKERESTQVRERHARTARET
jgi:hypothetical protein